MERDQIPLRRHRIQHIESYDVTDDDLDRIERDGSDLGLNFAFAQFGITVAASFIANWLIAPPVSRTVHDTFLIIISVGLFFGVAHGIKWYRNRRSFSATIRKIRERQVGPLGEKGDELRPSELQNLPSEDAEGEETKK